MEGIPKISIVIPTLNEEKFLPLLLESIQKQSFTGYEIIVADANSTDRTREIALSYGAKLVKGGLPAVGRNAGAKQARGEWLFFLDADVVLPEDFLEKAINELEENFYDLATCEFRPLSNLRLDKLLFSLTNLIVRLNTKINPRAAGFCIFITKRLFHRIGGFDESLKLAEDHDLVKRASRFRPLHFLEKTFLYVSVRRLEKEGRFSLVQKYAQVELNLLLRGAIREDVVEYEFGNFDEKSEKNKKFLDDLEALIKQWELKLNELQDKWLKKDSSENMPTDVTQTLFNLFRR